MEIIILAPEKFVSGITEMLGPLGSLAKSSVRNLLIFTLDSLVKSLVCSYFYLLRNIAKLTSHPELEIIIHAFTS